MRSAIGLLAAALMWLSASGPARADPTPSEVRVGCEAEQASRPKVIDLNAADERALLELPGIGPARARAIIAYRSEHGSFRSLSQLLQIKGIGRALLKQLRPLVAVTPAPA
jgi:competence protein ComEA